MSAGGGAADGRRRLAAILAADAADFSRLMSVDDAATVAALDIARGLFRDAIDRHQGRTIDMAGDSVLAVFETAAGAVDAALAIQHGLAAAAAATPDDRQLRFRIGVHLGDVIEKTDGTVYGDGVNIAARLQSLATPGGIAVSGLVHEAVRDRVDAAFVDRGEHAVKNIARRVRVWAVGAAGGASGRPAAGRVAAGAVALRRHPALAATLLAAAVAVIAVAWALATGDAGRRVAQWFGGGATHSLDSRMSIAVLPFANQSGDARRDYLSDGISADIVDALGRFSGLLVISNNAAQAYKDRRASTADIGRELGVRYVVQGGVREDGGRLRVAVELSDAGKGTLLWSDRFDGSGQQVFEIQDRIVRNIVGQLAVKLTRLEQQRTASRPTDSPQAYDLLLQARALLNRTDRSANREARGLLAQALQLSPAYAGAMVSMGEAEVALAQYGWVEDPQRSLQQAEALALQALSIDDPGAHVGAHGLLAAVYLLWGQYDKALQAVNRALQLNSSDASAYASRGGVLLWLGRLDEAIESLETAIRFDPNLRAGHLYSLAMAYELTGRHRQALALSDDALLRNPDFFNLEVIRAAALAETGDLAGARQAAEKVRRGDPFVDVATIGTRFVQPADRERLQASLRKAGL